MRFCDGVIVDAEGLVKVKFMRQLSPFLEVDVESDSVKTFL